MDFRPQGYEEDAEPSVRRINRVIAKVDGETWVYQYPTNESNRAVAVIKDDVELGKLHPYAGLILVSMVREAQRGH